MQDLNDMLFFAEVVERGGFAAAGRALGVPKSRLSRRVAALEMQLGVRLLQRTTRSLALTEVGQAYLRHCQELRTCAESAADLVASVHTAPRGTIHVSCPVTLAQTVLAELLPQFLQRHPQVRIEMQVSNRAVNLVEEGVDVALRVRHSVDDSASLVVKRLDTARQVLVASPALLQRQGTPASCLIWLPWIAWPWRPKRAKPSGFCAVRRGQNNAWFTHRAMWPMICSRSNTLRWQASGWGVCLITCAMKTSTLGAWCGCYPIGSSAVASCMPCFPRAVA